MPAISFVSCMLPILIVICIVMTSESRLSWRIVKPFERMYLLIFVFLDGISLMIKAIFIYFAQVKVIRIMRRKTGKKQRGK